MSSGEFSAVPPAVLALALDGGALPILCLSLWTGPVCSPERVLDTLVFVCWPDWIGEFAFPVFPLPSAGEWVVFRSSDEHSLFFTSLGLGFLARGPADPESFAECSLLFTSFGLGFLARAPPDPVLAIALAPAIPLGPRGLLIFLIGGVLPLPLAPMPMGLITGPLLILVTVGPPDDAPFTPNSLRVDITLSSSLMSSGSSAMTFPRVRDPWEDTGRVEAEAPRWRLRVPTLFTAFVARVLVSEWAREEHTGRGLPGFLSTALALRRVPGLFSPLALRPVPGLSPPLPGFLIALVFLSLPGLVRPGLGV